MARSRRTAVMVVDDNEAVRELLALYLELNGLDVFEAENGSDALARLRRLGRRPDAIVLDLDMPVMNGWQFRREQLADPDLATIPVVIASGDDPVGIRGEAHLRKPYAVAELLAVVKSVAAGRRAA